MRSKISVLIPVYNVEKYLEECMDSIMSQSFYEMEIICINDGSKDRSLEILEKCACVDSRIKIIDKPNTGYGKSMNIGLKTATGKYVAIVESDDFIDKNMMENLYDVAEITDSDVVRSNFYYYTEAKKDEFYECLKNCTYNKIIKPTDEPYLFWNGTWVWTSLYRRDFLLENNIWFNETPGAAYQDIAFTLKVLACAEKIYLLKDAYLHYRVDNMNASVQSREKVYCAFDEFKELWRFLDERPNVRDRVACFIPNFMIKNYHYQYNRILDKFKIPFLEKALQSVTWLKQRGFIKYDYLVECDINTDIFLKSHKDAMFFAKVDLQNRKFIREGFWRTVSKYKNIDLFGNGKVAKEVYDILIKHGYDICNVFVSNNSDCKVPLDDKKAQNISSNFSVDEDTLLLISIGENNGLKEILENFKIEHSERIVPMTIELRSILNDG